MTFSEFHKLACAVATTIAGIGTGAVKENALRTAGGSSGPDSWMFWSPARTLKGKQRQFHHHMPA
jgi:hypothetical protein